MQYWLTHPDLTPAHDWKVDAAALAQWARSGWQVRDDQSDPTPDLPTPPDPDSPDPALDSVEDAPDPVAPSPAPRTTTKKGEV